MKTLIGMVFLCTSLNALCFPAQIINCRFQQEESANITIHLNGSGGAFVVYRSEKLAQSIPLNVSDIFSQNQRLVVLGDLPAPWINGTSYRIEIENSPTGSFSYVNSEEITRINMVCIKH